jgi:anaerobic selenocysteine-containing dehydrogenase
MVQTTTCPLCEASCGILVDTEGEHIRSIRGDQNDPFSLGYVCPKATALADLHNDPDRLRAPIVACIG